jgi:SAM-dependent methyltransferase
MSALPAAVLERLRCPRCHRPLQGESEGEGEGVACSAGHSFARRDGYLDLSIDGGDEATVRTLRSFGYEWTTFDAVNPEDEVFWKTYFADVDLDALTDAVAIDVGCGKARYTRITARHVRAMVALDGSAAVEAAVRNLGDEPNATVVRSDLRHAPFTDHSFDLVTCLGVLHHLTDPRAGFDDVARLVAPGGTFLLYLYSRPTNDPVRAGSLKAASALRRVTVRLPHRFLRQLCWPLAYLLYTLVVVPGAFGQRRGIEALAHLPLGTYRGQPVRSLWLDTFDRLSAPIENRYTLDEVEPWFRAHGLEIEAVGEEIGLTIVARRPA